MLIEFEEIDGLVDMKLILVFDLFWEGLFMLEILRKLMVVFVLVLLLFVVLV